MDGATVSEDSGKLRAAIHTLTIAEVEAALGTGGDGLGQAEAARRLARFGPNAIRPARGRPLIVRFLANYTHLMAILLWIGGIVGFFARMPQLGVAIWLVNVINGIFSFWQEYRAEKATEALRMLLPSFARVVRDGEELRLPAEELVPGDVLLLAEGDRICADGRLIAEAELRVDQSVLTGESHPVRKTSDPVPGGGMGRVELPNLVFAGTTVTAGTGRAVVFATGMDTAFGAIASLTQGVGEAPSPLQVELGRVTRVVTALAAGMGLLFFTLAVALAGVETAEGFIFAMGMIVAFVPEGLVPTVTLSLAMGVQRMARRNALIKKLSSVETLGCCTVICTDKTGTLTENEMTVRGLWIGGHSLTVTGAGYGPEGTVLDEGHPVDDSLAVPMRRMLLAAGLCNDARLLAPEDAGGRWSILGDPTEAALKVAAAKAGVDLDAEEGRFPRVREIPFESRRKMMSTVHRVTAPRGEGGGPLGLVVFVKGAPREVAARCCRIALDGGESALDDGWREKIAAATDRYARGALRVLAVAARELPPGFSDFTPAGVEADLTFLGLVAMMDPPRPEVAEAVERCRRAGIRIIMVTGDYGLTAESVARRIGCISGAPPRIVTGAELEALSPAALEEILREEVIFARAAPEQKLRVVAALQGLGHVVAVTGDGVNDAPALKKADIGVAMGLSGTDVAREAADMVLADDNFASIVNAVEEGRAVYANIRRFATYVFTSNMAEAVPFVVMLFSRGAIPLPLTVMQVLSIDLGTDMVPAIGLGAELPEEGVMDRPPRPRNDPLLNRGVLARALLWYGVIEAAAAMSAYFFLNWLHGWPRVPLAAEGTQVYRMATTMTLAGVVAAQVGAVFACRSDRVSILTIGFFSNRLVLLGVAVELALLGLLVYVPFLREVFHTAPLGPVEWCYVLAWAPAVLLADEARKAVMRRRGRSTPSTGGSS
uniref:Cation-transporting P-type ATPase n=1 Tax=Geobacter metallireducens TaxID=28232 RepID=A0A831U0S6_GEOME